MVKRQAAVFTVAQNEPVFLPIWSRYYRQHFDPQDLFVLDHDSSDVSTVCAASACNRVPVHNDVSFDHFWLRDTVQHFQRFLLQSYETVLFTEVDEIVFADPRLFPRGLRQFIEKNQLSLTRCTGYELVHDLTIEPEPPIDLSINRKILKQRRWIQPSETYSKPLLAKVPLTWGAGFHRLEDVEVLETEGLYLLHLHRMDYQIAWQKCQENARRRWSMSAIDSGAGYQNRIESEDRFRIWFYSDFHDGRPLNPKYVPDAWKDVI